MILIEENDDRFYIAKSTIPNAGMGLFAKVDLEPNDALEVIGALVRTGSVADQCTKYAHRYKFLASKGDHIVPMGYAGMINSTDDKKKQNVQITCMPPEYRKRSQHCERIVYLVLKRIKKDEELLGNYGGDYSKILSYMNRGIEELNSEEQEWNEFLEYDLYGLGRLGNQLEEG